jgi:hypothetical protein
VEDGAVLIEISIERGKGCAPLNQTLTIAHEIVHFALCQHHNRSFTFYASRTGLLAAGDGVWCSEAMGGVVTLLATASELVSGNEPRKEHLMLTVTWHADGHCTIKHPEAEPMQLRPLADEPPHHFAMRMGHVVEELRKLTDPPLPVTHQAK